jgi:hypothetical protein
VPTPNRQARIEAVDVPKSLRSNGKAAPAPITSETNYVKKHRNMKIEENVR